MKKHTTIGASMLDNLGSYRNEELVRTAYEICRWHHERWDGRGYPDGAGRGPHPDFGAGGLDGGRSTMRW